MAKNKGFTLIELLMVVIVIGVLLSIAIPNYMTSIEKSKAGKAKQSLQSIRSSESWYRAHMDEYTNDITILEDWGLPLPAITADTDWAYTVESATAILIEIRATRQDGPYTGEFISMNEEGMLSVSAPGIPWLVN